MKSSKLISAMLISSMILGFSSCSEVSENPSKSPEASSAVTTAVGDPTVDDLPENTLGLSDETESHDLLFNYGLAPVCVDGKWGFINEKGEMVIEPQFDKSNIFRQGVIIINADGKHRLMNTSGEWITEPADGIASHFTEGYCMIRTLNYDENGNAVSMQEKFIDSSGRTVLELPENTNCWPVRDGLVLSRSEDGLSVYSIEDGKLFTLEGVSTFAGDESTYRFFFDGLLCVQDGATDKWGIVNKKGEWVVEPKFDYLGHFEGGLAYAQAGEYGGFINTSGEWVIEPIYKKDVSMEFTEGLAGVETDTGAGYIDESGNMVITLDGYEWVLTWEFDEGVASVLTDKGAGIIDKNGNWTIPPSLFSIGRFNCGVVPVETSIGKYDFVNSKGEFITNAGYRAAERFYDDGYGVAMKPDGKWVIIDTDGNVVIDGGFDGIGHYYTYYDEDGSIMPCASGR